MNLQEDAINNTKSAERIVWVALFFIFTRLLIPIIKHSIKHRWVFVLIGLTIAHIIHFMMYGSMGSLANWLSVPVYLIFGALGTWVTIRMRKRMKVGRRGVPTNPIIPKELLR